jgi:class 3 adenylate cyclase
MHGEVDPMTRNNGLSDSSTEGQAGTHVKGPQSVELDASRAIPYVARILQQHLVHDPHNRSWIGEGTAAFVDISGFTKLSERLAKKGREGAEQITEAIEKSFESILAVAYENGGSLLKFGGDALLLWFEGDGHALRACRATVLMRRTLRRVGQIDIPGARLRCAWLRACIRVPSTSSRWAPPTPSCCRPAPAGAAWWQWSIRPPPVRSW